MPVQYNLSPLFLTVGQHFPSGLRKADKMSKAGLLPGNQVTEAKFNQTSFQSVSLWLAEPLKPQLLAALVTLISSGPICLQSWHPFNR